MDTLAAPHATAARTTAMPLVSLIVSTRNRADRLDRFFAALGALRCAGPWELIVVDNGSTDATAEIVARHLGTLGAPSLLVHEPRPGLSRARNAGVLASRGDILVFTDDDCYPEPDFLTRYVEIFADPVIGFAGGRILLHDRTDYPLTIREDTEARRLEPGRIVPCGLIQGANMAFRREAMLEIGGFDPQFGSGTPFPAEDWEATARAASANWAGGYFPGPTVSHHHGRKEVEAGALIDQYDFASGAVYAKLISLPGTRMPYLRHWMRRMLGDSKFHRRKIRKQIEGARAYWRARQMARAEAA
jgi:glycosyltransferase involved in cell wall biosynthesis